MGSAAYHVAAAMALSMSAVAFAINYGADGEGVTSEGVVGSVTNPNNQTQTLGKDKIYIINPGSVTGRATTATIDSATLDALIDADLVKTDVAILSNKKALKSTPSVVGGTLSDKTTPAAVMKVSFKDTWSTGSETVEMRVRITAKENLYSNGAPGGITPNSNSGANPMLLQKGDTVTLDSFKIEASYQDVTEYGENITMTLDEVTDRYIIAYGNKLYNGADDNDKVVIYFKNNRSKDIAAYEIRISENQKDVNLGYDTTAIDEVTDAYPDIDFEFINFKAQVSGKNRFTNSGTMYFNAIGGANTKVYEVVDGVIDPSQPLDAKYDSDDKTVSVSGIRELTQYVVASEELPYEPEEESSSSEAPAAPAETPANPSTGAL